MPYCDLYNISCFNTAISSYLKYTANNDGTHPTKEGYDACLGHIDGAIHACCGHGAEKGYIMYPDKTVEIGEIIK